MNNRVLDPDVILKERQRLKNLPVAITKCKLFRAKPQWRSSASLEDSSGRFTRLRMTANKFIDGCCQLCWFSAQNDISFV